MTSMTPNSASAQLLDTRTTCRRLEGKVALITASTAGIGLGIAERLALEGAHVIISSRKQDNVDRCVENLRRRIGGDANRVLGRQCHVGKKEDIQELVNFAVEAHGRIDILVSNAAVNPAAGPILEMSPSVIDKIFDVNVKAAITLCQAAAPHMPSHGGSAIVFVSSYTAFNPSAPIAMYAVSKTTLIGLTKALAEELGPERGIRVNCVAPGIVPTKFASALVATNELKEYHESNTLLKRLGRPQDIAGVVAMLVSEDGSYVSGETIVVAGGMQSRL